jgi:hypothetical protein
VKHLAAIAEGWSWAGLHPKAVIDDNDFGNVIVLDTSGRYWRITPEDPRCEVVAATRDAWEALAVTPSFVEGWQMAHLVDEARARLGPLGPSRKYCLRLAGVLGGQYGGENFATIDFDELLRASGDLAHQLVDVKDGEQIRLVVK